MQKSTKILQLLLVLSLGYQKVRNTWQLYKEGTEKIETNLETENSKGFCESNKEELPRSIIWTRETQGIK